MGVHEKDSTISKYKKKHYLTIKKALWHFAFRSPAGNQFPKTHQKQFAILLVLRHVGGDE